MYLRDHVQADLDCLSSQNSPISVSFSFWFNNLNKNKV